MLYMLSIITFLKSYFSNPFIAEVGTTHKVCFGDIYALLKALK